MSSVNRFPLSLRAVSLTALPIAILGTSLNLSYGRAIQTASVAAGGQKVSPDLVAALDLGVTQKLNWLKDDKKAGCLRQALLIAASADIELTSLHAAVAASVEDRTGGFDAYPAPLRV